jgi:DNA-binding HxlR family transcriptional regulator
MLQAPITDSASRNSVDPFNTVQKVLKCKWVLLILDAIQQGHCRPSTIERSIAGMSHKILHQRLAKLTRLQVIERLELASRAQHVEYRMTDFGAAIGKVVQDIQALRQRFPPTES